MTEFNEKKISSVSLEELSETKLNGSSNYFLMTILGIGGALISGFALFVIYLIIGGECILYSNCFLDVGWHIIYPFIVSIGIGVFISLGVKKSNYRNRKIISLLTVICIFLAYLFFNISVYVKYNLLDYGSFHVLGFPAFILNSAVSHPLSFDCWPYGLDFNPVHTEMYRYTNFLLQVYHTITLGKLDMVSIAVIINIQIWLIQFFITYFCAWKFINFICPCLIPSDCLSKSEKSWMLFFIKKFKKNK